MSKYTLIKGTFHVVGFSPDGDSLMFKANNVKNWAKVQTTYSDIFAERLTQADGAVQLRLQGIDALETHYSPSSIHTPAHLKEKENDNVQKPKPKGTHQPDEYAQRATAVFLTYLGVNRTKWAKRWGHTWIDKAWIQQGKKEVMVDDKFADSIPGYIITRDIERKGRPISWIFAGKTRSRDGTQYSKTQIASRIERSANYHLLAQGVVYPYFFMTLPASLRSRLIKATETAQANAKTEANLWSNDRTMRGITINSIASLTEKYEMFPYLFRKLIKHAFRQDTLAYWHALETDTAHFTPDMEKMSLTGFFDGGNPYVFLGACRKKDFWTQICLINADKRKKSAFICVNQRPISLVLTSPTAC
ncbi:MAG: hypothetical protein GY943_07080 [Chloroflexi bacterium]|nr:hypothetical protein [Chloroflexota bacterium]